MQPFDRSLLLFYTFIMTLFLLAAIPFLAGWLDWRIVAPLSFPLTERPEIIFVFLGLMILMGARLFWAGIRPARKHVIVHEGASGQVRIALTAIEDLVEKVVSPNSGIREVKSRVLALPEGIGIKVQATVAPDTQIPALSRTIQEQVKEKVFEVTGLPVQQVHVFVQSFAARKPRVE